jgi:uncharacterized protein (DUF1499 family)
MKIASVPLVLAVLSAIALVASGFGVQFGVWDFRFGFTLIRWSLYTGIACAVLALIGLAVPRVRAGHAAGLAAALAIGVGVACFPLYWQQMARSVPPINDITTDTENPPAFVGILPLRAGAPVPAAYPGSEVAALQHGAYPDIRPLDVATAPDATFARVLEVVKSSGWTLVASDAASGRIEATATTPWFGFHDDVVIRITPTSTGSRIDVRSHSRLGRGDLGANAKRIRAFLAKLSG